jgi:hypothetical protein
MFASLWVRVRLHVLPFIDPTVLLLLAIGVLLPWFIDPVMAKTLLQWAMFLFAVAAFCAIICMLLFRRIRFDEWIDEARKGNPIAGHIFLAMAIFMGLVFVAAALYVRAG